MRSLFAVVLLVVAFAKHHEPIHRRLYTREFEMSEKAMQALWSEWKDEFDVEYPSKLEDNERFEIFSQMLNTVIEHNEGNYTYKLGLNQFSAMTAKEFRERMTCLNRKKMPTDRTMNHDNRPRVFNPTSVDWSEPAGKYVTPVKNQKSCGSCWAFSATGSIESRYAIKTGKLVSLSEQELVDCSKAEGNQGCNGGLMDDAFEYVKKAGGLCSEAEYPYVARTETTCKARQCSQRYDAITGFTDVQKDNAMALETAVVAGPVSVAVEADQLAFQGYHSGIVNGRCGAKLDHGVLVVGYGVQGSEKYWKVKNSWGATWGEAGYLRICKECHKDFNKGECGIRDDPSFPVA